MVQSVREIGALVALGHGARDQGDCLAQAHHLEELGGVVDDQPVDVVGSAAAAQLVSIPT